MHTHRATTMLSTSSLTTRHSLQGNPTLCSRRRPHSTSTCSVMDNNRPSNDMPMPTLMPSPATSPSPCSERDITATLFSTLFTIAERVWSIFLWHCVVCVWLVQLTRIFQRAQPAATPRTEAKQRTKRERVNAPKIHGSIPNDSVSHGDVTHAKMDLPAISIKSTAALGPTPPESPPFSPSSPTDTLVSPLTPSSPTDTLVSPLTPSSPVDKALPTNPFFGPSLVKRLTNPRLIVMMEAHEKDMKNRYENYVLPTKRRTQLPSNAAPHAATKNPALVQLAKDIQIYVAENNVLYTDALTDLTPSLQSYLSN